jgi:hypothetical protein
MEPLRVEVVVRLGLQDAPLSRWELSVAKPSNKPRDCIKGLPQQERMT